MPWTGAAGQASGSGFASVTINVPATPPDGSSPIDLALVSESTAAEDEQGAVGAPADPLEPRVTDRILGGQAWAFGFPLSGSARYRVQATWSSASGRSSPEADAELRSGLRSVMGGTTFILGPHETSFTSVALGDPECGTPRGPGVVDRVPRGHVPVVLPRDLEVVEGESVPLAVYVCPGDAEGRPSALERGPVAGPCGEARRRGCGLERAR